MRLSSGAGLAMCAAVIVFSVPASQQPIPSSPGGKVAVEIALQAGAESYRFTGQASCAHEPNGYIYMVPAKLWSVSHSERTHSLSLTFWRPASGSPDMFTLHVQGAGRTYEATTVKTEHGGSLKGSGEITFAPAGPGGTFTVDATASNGARISGTIKCRAFRAAYAEGGN